MNWFSTFLTSSVGRKLVMSLTGLFLIIFLVVHLIGNWQLLAGDGGTAFNDYAKFMTSFGPIKVVSYLLYASIVVHAIQGWLLWRKNSAARGVNYAVKRTRTVKTSAGASKNMGWLGTIIFVFILIHMYQFWFQMHWGIEPMAGTDVKDLYTVVERAYTNLGFVIFYVICMAVVGY
ncbi:MAG: succinate dehydrogenase, partial [Lewinella sp.]|nr:succinate dehydrogenase [Lewinella sp.]